MRSLRSDHLDGGYRGKKISGGIVLLKSVSSQGAILARRYNVPNFVLHVLGPC